MKKQKNRKECAQENNLQNRKKKNRRRDMEENSVGLNVDL